MFTFFMIALAVAAALAIFIAGLYNRLVTFRNTRENAFADIDVQMKQRYDLIPQLVETVKGYMKHESDTLIKITQARSSAMNATGIDQKIAAENQLNSALNGLKVQFEAYPDLKANQNFLELQEEMEDIENKLAAARRHFNSCTKEYNNAVETFPANLIAAWFHFKREPMFDLAEERKQYDKAPTISFN